MPSESRAALTKHETDEVDLSFLSDDEDILSLKRISKRAKGKAPATDRNALYTNTQASQPKAFSRSTDSQRSRPTSSVRPASVQTRPSNPQGAEPVRGSKPCASTTRRKQQTQPRRTRRSDTFVDDEEDDIRVNQRDDQDDEEESDDDDDIDIDDIIASTNGGGSRNSAAPAKQAAKTKSSAARRSSTKSSASLPRRAIASTPITRSRAPPRSRYLLANDADDSSDHEHGNLSDQGSDSLQEEIEDLYESDNAQPVRRSQRHAHSNRSAQHTRPSSHSTPSKASDRRTAKSQREFVVDDDDDEDEDKEEETSRQIVQKRKSRSSRAKRFRRSEDEDDEDDGKFDVNEEDEEDSNDADELDDSSDDEYGNHANRKRPAASRPAASAKRRRLSRGTSRGTPRSPRSRAVPRRRATFKRTRVRQPKMRFALQEKLPEPIVDPPTLAETLEVIIDEAKLSEDLKSILYFDGIDAICSHSEGAIEQEAADADAYSEEEVQVISEAESVSSSDAMDPYEEPEATVDRHWQSCKRCTDGPALPLYNKALSQLKLAQKREAKKLDRKAPERFDSRGRQRKSIIDDTSGAITPVQVTEEWIEVLEDRGGWFECKTCSVSWHWGCLPLDTQRAILVGINRDRVTRHKAIFGEQAPAPPPVRYIDIDEMVDTNSCPDCFGYASYCTLCKANVYGNRTVEEQLGFTEAMLQQYAAPPSELTASRLFRCKRCSRATHYECLARAQTETDTSIEEVASSIQEKGWLCSDCHRWPAIDNIIAWRQLDCSLWNDEGAKRADYATLSPRENLSREYLVKFKGRSFRETEWIPHDWLRILHQNLLSNFLAKGSRLELEPEELIESTATLASARRNRASFALEGGRALLSTPVQTRLVVKKTLKVDETGEVDIGPPGPQPDAQRRIPKPWKTPDRILAVRYYSSILKDEDEPGGDVVSSDSVPLNKLEPSDYIRSWVHVAKLLIKWQDQPYEGSTWEGPPTRRKQPDIFYETQESYRSFLIGQKVTFPGLTSEERRIKRERREARSGSHFRALDDQPHCIEGGELIDFQLEGVNWLRYGWYHQKPGILADEMGLGKTVQIITFLASIWNEGKAGPFLMVVPNSTLPNWMREFEKWMPQFRVVPYWGEGEARDMISKYEFFHSKKTLAQMDGKNRPIKFHVVVASDTSVRIDSMPLRKVGSWDVIIVDEGQNLKSGKSVLMKRLNELHAEHRVITTGTPLNNNVTELFNLLNWLEPEGQWRDVKALETEYSVLKPEVIEELQKRLKPYFLRRLKKEVLDLPPEVELIVPTSLRPIQKRIYRSILESNIEDIQALAASREPGFKKGRKSTVANLNNTLMQLRKCIQHPYLIAPDLETREGEANYEATWEHQRLIDASAKLSILQRLLPKLKAQGHRILLFSQFVINLNIIEVFLRGEGYKFLRLDGGVGQKQRQKGIDAFNAPDSPYFIYMISTRAGGVGINLASADTVIIMDPDWNPHVDMQAIARAHRIGQTKKLLVFTLICKATAEESIIEGAKRKMMLDHLIVQNLNNEDEKPEELESILKFGAQALFAEGGTEESERDIRYTDDDLDSLLRRREDATDDDRIQEDGAHANGEPKGNFSYARVWEADQATEAAGGVAPTTAVDDDFWADLLQKHREDAAKRAQEAREKEAQEKRASRRDRIKAMLAEEEAAEMPPPPSKRAPGRPKKVPKAIVDEDFRAALAESDSDEDELINAVQAEDELLPAVQASRKRQQMPSKAAIAATAAAKGSAGGFSVAPGASSDASSSAAPAVAMPAPAATPAKAKAVAASPTPSSARKGKPSPPSLAGLQRDLMAEHRLPRAASLGTIDLSLPVSAVSSGQLAAMRRVMLSLLHDSDFGLDVAARSLTGEGPDLAPPHMRFQLTQTHINYYMQTFSVPRDLFEAAFSIIPEDNVPPEILALPHGGAIALDWRKIRELLLRTATYMVLALRKPKDQQPWKAAIEEWNKARMGKPPPRAIEVADSPPSSRNVALPPPEPQTSGAAVDVLRDPLRSAVWLSRIVVRGDAELTKIAQLCTSNPLSTASPNLMLIVQNFLDEKGPKPVYGPAKLSIHSGMPRSAEFVDPDVMGPPTSVPSAAASSPTPSASTPSASQVKSNRVAAALSRLSAFSGGSPMRVDVSKKDLSKLNLDVAVTRRKPRIKSSRSSIGGSPRSSIALSPSPSPVGAGVFTPSSSSNALDDDGEDEEAPFFVSAQTCIICGGAFHYLNRCPVMEDVTKASARWFQLCDQLRVLMDRGLGDGDSDVSAIKTTIKVMARRLNGLRGSNDWVPLVPPFA
ncbi:probable CHD1 - transcriptional regulator [Melanopsichium pennsylvanicum]|uniref:Related to helicase-dna-binding protein n=2 Tax=Melanopsichium pennsylvanicum TaxID=63383 RepID=A0A077QYR8_9BASI|nr:related to helicase-dna-binding protein [Melanopsichium pennsylvanicum 4]SNX84130.1 probable CHD1 - transcriptional regulator [Melanopsichium pennsylvanicum]